MIYEFKNPRAEMYKLHPSVFSVVKHTNLYCVTIGEPTCF